MDYNCIVVLGPTASGKTSLACLLAYHLNGEVISADSRQVYKKLNIGTGKDLEEYEVNGRKIPYYLIDLIEPSQQYYLHDFIRDLNSSFKKIKSENKLPIICGGTGLYLDALRKDFSLTQIPENSPKRAEMELLDKETLLKELDKFPIALWKQVDTNSKKRIIRGIEVADFLQNHPAHLQKSNLPYKPFYIGINITLTERKKRISQRLEKRLNNGMIEEVESLLKQGISHERLQQLGLEYKFISYYLLGEITRQELFTKLQTAIFQFAKRQSTWFRKMEKEGVKITWVEADSSMNEILKLLRHMAQ